MITTINAKQLAIMYQMGYSTFQKYLANHRNQLRALATQRTGRNGNTILSQNFNSRQLNYIVETIMGDPPFGYRFNGKILVKDQEFLNS